VGWPILIVGMFLLACAWVYLVVTTSATEA
jgi:hypothetical protein